MNFLKRDQLILTLNQLSAILQFDKPIPEEAKQRTCKKIVDTIASLVVLSTSAPTLSINTDQLASYDVFEETVFGQLIFELSKADMSQMINQLIAIRDALKSDKAIPNEKRALAVENRRIIGLLLDLPCKEQSNE